MKTTLLKLGEVRKTVVVDPELDGCDLRDSRAWRRIAGGVCLLGNDRAASVRLGVLRITRFKWTFANYPGKAPRPRTISLSTATTWYRVKGPP
jgi:hypothetical protein